MQDRSQHNVAALILAGIEIVAAGVVLFWAVAELNDAHSMSLVTFVAGTIAGSCTLLVPGLLLLARGWVRWLLQPLPVMFVLLLIVLMRDGFRPF